jgi:hypothetical protein
MEPNAKKPRRRETITLPDDLAAKLGCREVYEDELEARLEVCEEMRLEEDGGILRALLSPARDGGFSRDVTQKLNHIFKHRVLRRLSSGDVALLSRVNAACRRGVLAAVGELPLPVNEFVCRQERFMWACSNGLPLDDKRTCAVVARRGNLEMLKYARANGCPWDEGTCAAAARGGHLDVLMWARANGCPWDHRVLPFFFTLTATDESHREVLEWASENGIVLNPNDERFPGESMGHFDDYS